MKNKKSYPTLCRTCQLPEVLIKLPSIFYRLLHGSQGLPGSHPKNSTLNDQKLVCCILDTTLVPSVPQNINVSFEAYLNLVGETTRTRALYPFYMEALNIANMSSKHKIAAFTAQVC